MKQPLAASNVNADPEEGEEGEEEPKPAAKEPATRDDLFGTGKQSSQPESRESLFGAAPAEEDTRPYRIGGFLDLLSAYTYERPVHWSRAVARLQLSAQGQLSSSVKWKVGGRVEFDPIYLASDFYPDAVKNDMRLAFIHGENYLDFERGDWALRVGAQQIVWGEVVGLFFADVVSARDMREFLLPTFDIIRIPQWAARLEYHGSDSHLELVWIPVPTFDRIGKPGADFYPVALPQPTTPQEAAPFKDPEHPERSLSNGNFGVRANTLLSGWDIAGFYYRSFSTQPTFYRQASSDPALPFEFVPRYDRIWQAGGTLSKDLGEAVFRGEAIYTDGQRYSSVDPVAPQGVIDRSSFEYIASVEFPIARETRVNLQGFQRIYRGGGSDIAVKGDGFGASIYVTTKLTQSWEPQLLWIRNFKVGDSLVRPRLNWYAEKNLLLSVGADIFSGPANGFFGRYNTRDRVYLEARLDF